MSTIPWLGPSDPFPDPQTHSDPDPEVPGLLAVSERIFANQLERAYRNGIFPWYSVRQPVLWWSPDPRMILNPADLKISHSLRKSIQHFMGDPHMQLRVDHDFSGVMRACATTERAGQDGTWITTRLLMPIALCTSKATPIASRSNNTRKQSVGCIVFVLAKWSLGSPCSHG